MNPAIDFYEKVTNKTILRAYDFFGSTKKIVSQITRSIKNNFNFNIENIRSK